MKTIIVAVNSHASMEVEDSTPKNVKINLVDATGVRGMTVLFAVEDIKRLAKGLK